jgi:NAD(P)-dependent dehydrogenase (short-subunit alcohol dehydrogenase family)
VSTNLKNVVITGAGGGIASAVVEALAARGGVNVMATDLNRAGLDALEGRVSFTDGELVTRVVDVTDSSAIDASVAEAVERWGSLHGIANIAGYTPPGQDTADTSDELFDRVMAINARSAFAGMRAALPHLVETGGAVVNIGSFFAIRGGTNFATYTAAKHAVVGMSKAAAWEYAPKGVRVNVIAPGPTYTDMVLTAFDAINPDDREAGKRVMESRSPSGRLSYPEEIAQTIIWALLDAPVHLTGQVIAVDGAKAS